MRYNAAVENSFQQALAELPEVIRQDVWADKFKYLTDVTLLRGATPPGKVKFLDIGGARGVNNMMLQRLGDYELHLVDRFDRTEAEMLNQQEHPTRRMWETRGIEVHECDVIKDRLPYPDNTFDLVSAVDIVEHFPSSSKHFFGEVIRVLRPGGILLTGCPNIANLQNRIKMLLGKSIHSRLDVWHDTTHYIGHIREFTPAEFETLLKSAGFNIVQKRMGEEELDSVIKDRAKLQRDRSAGSNRLDLSKPKDLIFYSVVLLYYGFVQLFPGCRYFSRFIARKPAPQE